MQNQTLAESATKLAFTDAVWARLARGVSEAFDLSDVDAARLTSSQVGKLIAAIPYLAGSRDPDRIATAHLCVYFAASAGSNSVRSLFDHRPSDDTDVLRRLDTIAQYVDGNSEIIAKGMALLGIVLISSYHRDRKKDEESGEYNPLLNGSWDYPSVLEELTQQAEAVDCPQMDRIVSPVKAPQLLWF